MKNKMMRKIFILSMAGVVVFSGCSYLASAQYSKGMDYQLNQKPTYDNSQNNMFHNPPNQNKEQLEAALKQLISDGVFTESEAASLKSYLEKNRPGMGSAGQNKETQDPIRGAIEAGIITQSQARKLGEILRPIGENNAPDKNNGLNKNEGFGSFQGPREQLSSITFKEAQDIEAKLLKEVGYSADEGRYPIVDTGQEAFYSDSREINKPGKYDDFYGQDGNYKGNTPNYTDNGNGTITDNVTGLMWQQDPGEKMTWEEAVENVKDFELAGYDDWRLPTIKELYSLAIDPMFDSTSIVDVNGETNYPFYWTSTTHLDGPRLGSNAVYIAFGEALGYFNDTFMDVHGAGAQRSDPKTGDKDSYPQYGHGPQGDSRAVYNFVRAVRIAD